MRLLLALLLLIPLPAFAADWGHYTNTRFGYAVDVPPRFVAEGESDNGDGQVFKTPTAVLTVFGGNVMETDFEAGVGQREQFAKDEGWAITYQVSSPQKASWSGKRGGRILYGRMIALCGGQQFASFELEYSSADLKAFNPVVDRLVSSLRATEGSASC
jgi:hypothetical protein